MILKKSDLKRIIKEELSNLLEGRDSLEEISSKVKGAIIGLLSFISPGKTISQPIVNDSRVTLSTIDSLKAIPVKGYDNCYVTAKAKAEISEEDIIKTCQQFITGKQEVFAYYSSPQAIAKSINNLSGQGGADPESKNALSTKLVSGLKQDFSDAKIVISSDEEIKKISGVNTVNDKPAWAGVVSSIAGLFVPSSKTTLINTRIAQNNQTYRSVINHELTHLSTFSKQNTLNYWDEKGSYRHYDPNFTSTAKKDPFITSYAGSATENSAYNYALRQMLGIQHVTSKEDLINKFTSLFLEVTDEGIAVPTKIKTTEEATKFIYKSLLRAKDEFKDRGLTDDLAHQALIAIRGYMSNVALDKKTGYTVLKIDFAGLARNLNMTAALDKQGSKRELPV